ncbi:MAG: alternative ribosome rescue aminoacyl-tRNA hydrolase ArfB [Chitinophagaceae bacterium]
MLINKLLNEITIQTSRSGGKGGQHVNKVETQVEIRWPIKQSAFFSEEEKRALITKLSNLLNKDGYIIVRANEARTQLENKSIALKKLEKWIHVALKKDKKRIKTKIPNRVHEKRIENKKRLSERKSLRQKPLF